MSLLCIMLDAFGYLLHYCSYINGCSSSSMTSIIVRMKWKHSLLKFYISVNYFIYISLYNFYSTYFLIKLSSADWLSVLLESTFKFPDCCIRVSNCSIRVSRSDNQPIYGQFSYITCLK